MRRYCLTLLLITTLTLTAAAPLCAAPATLTVAVDKPGHAISPMLYGIFFEDINCSADGGIYAELVRNRNFEDSGKPERWEAVGDSAAGVQLTVDSAAPVSPKNPRSLKVKIANPTNSRAGVANNGFWGMAVTKGEIYRLSLFARAGDGFTGPLTVSLEGSNGTIYAQKTIRSLTADWKHYRVSLKPKVSDPKARLVISASRPGVFWLDMVSLFPEADLEEPAERFAARPGGDAGGVEAGLRPFPGRLLGRRRHDGASLSVEADHRGPLRAPHPVQHLAIPRYARHRIS